MTDITVSVIGKTGDGKSTLLNNLFKKEEFRTSKDDGRVTLSVVTEHGYWRGDKNQKLTCIDTPGLVDKIPHPDSMTEQAGFQNVFSFIEHLAKGFNSILLCFNINNVRFDAQYESMLKLLGVVLGDAVFDHMVVVFTFCEGESIEDLKKKMKTEFSKTLKDAFGRDFPMIFTNKDSETEFDDLKKILLKLEKYDSEFFQKLRKIQENEDSTKLDEEKFVEEQFTKAFYSKVCEIL
jgi:GTPase SAR1 family protein